MQCLAAADVVLYDHLVHARLLRYARAGRREDRRRHGRAAAARTGSDLLSAGREGARGKDGRAPEVGRSVRVRSAAARKRCFCTSKACRSRSCPGVPAGVGDAELRRRSDHLSWRRRHAHVRARPRGRGQDARVGRLGEPGTARRHDRLLRGTAAGAAHARRADCARPRPPDESAALVYDGTLPTQETVAGTLEELAQHAKQSADRRPAIAGRRPRRRPARAPALVRLAAAVRQARLDHAAARAGRGARRAARSRGRRSRSRRR